MNGAHPPGPADRELWRRSLTAVAARDEAEHFLDLASFADDRLDEDAAACIAALIASDRDAAEDVAAARSLAAVAPPAADERIVARAIALAATDADADAAVIAFPPRPRVVIRSWFSAASWSGLAAAIVLAGWLGFDLGSGFYDGRMVVRSADEAPSSELIDPAVPLMRDFTENSQI
jgi:hypothetical protein